MTGAIMQQTSLSQGTKLLIVDLVKKLNREENIDDVINVVSAVADDLDKQAAINATALKEETLEKIRGEVATKEFVKLEVSRLEKKLDKHDYMFYGIFALILLFDSPLGKFLEKLLQ